MPLKTSKTYTLEDYTLGKSNKNGYVSSASNLVLKYNLTLTANTDGLNYLTQHVSNTF